MSFVIVMGNIFFRNVFSVSATHFCKFPHNKEIGRLLLRGGDDFFFKKCNFVSLWGSLQYLVPSWIENKLLRF